MIDGEKQGEGFLGNSDRRDALKKIGIGAGVAWSAPVAMGFFTSAASAGTPSPSTTTDNTNPDPECQGADCQTFTLCSTNTNCVCFTTSDGPYCLPGRLCVELDACDANLQCQAGFVCLIDSCCIDPVCQPLSEAADCPPSNGPGAPYKRAAGARKGLTSAG